MTINRNDKRHQFTRGAEVLRHEYGMYFSAIFFSFVMATICSIGTSIFMMNAALSSDDTHIILCRSWAKIQVISGKPGEPITLALIKDGRLHEYHIPAAKLLDLTEPEMRVIDQKLMMSLWVSLGAGVALFFITNWAWRRFGSTVSQDEVVRGAVFANPADVTKKLTVADGASLIRLAGVPLPAGKEVLNIGVSGTVGSGKSVAIQALLDDIRKQGSRAVVFDSTGEYIQHFYRTGIDTILNPFDDRSPPWAPWNEIRRPYDYASLAESFIPVMNSREPFWEEGGQAVLEDVLSRLAKTGDTSNRRLIEVVNVLTLQEIQTLVRRLPASVYMDPDAAKTALGIRMNVVRAAKALRYLGDGDPAAQFSIRHWVNDESTDSWLFLSTKEEMLATLRPMLTAWFDIAARAMLSLPPSRTRRIFPIVDELASLQRVNTLLDAATRGRKYGVCLGLGYQNISQIRKVYGDDDAQTLISMLQNRLALMVPDAQTAKYISENLGMQEILEKDENLSFGTDSIRDAVTIATRREERSLVLTSEIQGLPEMTGYLRLAGRNEVMKVSFTYRDRPIIAMPFIEREVISYALDD